MNRAGEVWDVGETVIVGAVRILQQWRLKVGCPEGFDSFSRILSREQSPLNYMDGESPLSMDESRSRSESERGSEGIGGDARYAVDILDAVDAGDFTFMQEFLILTLSRSLEPWSTLR